MKKRLLLSLILSTFLFFQFFKQAAAENEFLVDSTVTYEVQDNGTTLVTQNIILENQVSDLYATSYTLELNNIKPYDVIAYQGEHQFNIDLKEKGQKTIITVNFDDALVGKGKARDFNISFSEDSFAVRTGEIWEISIPRLSQDSSFRNYSLILSIPTSFGEEAYLSPEPKRIDLSQNNRLYTFDRKSSQEIGITGGFGKFQVFAFTLNYHLENPLNKNTEVEIAIPPDTAYQKLYYQVIEPKPNNVLIDADGNWLAIYKLSSRERLDPTVKGSVQIFAGPRPFLKYPQGVLQANLKESEFWQILDPSIISLAERLKTPFEIYDFVSKNLSYDFERVKPNTVRLGAKEALANPDSAICMEYTDAFIAIARAAGIPAREINGFAYTENPKIQPLSLVSDVLHAWPEYWDGEKDVWVPIDPTWASTTGGVDYFGKLDLRHFTFVIHGIDASHPYPPGSYKLGPNPQKDVFVNFGQLPEKKMAIPDVFATFDKSPGLLGKRIKVELKNPGPVALYNTLIEVFFDEELTQKTQIDILPPWGNYKYETFMPYGFLGSKAPEKITIITTGQKIEIPTNKNQIVIYNLSLIFIILTSLLLLVILRLKRINPFRWMKIDYEKFRKKRNKPRSS